MNHRPYTFLVLLFTCISSIDISCGQRVVMRSPHARYPTGRPTYTRHRHAHHQSTPHRVAPPLPRNSSWTLGPPINIRTRTATPVLSMEDLGTLLPPASNLTPVATSTPDATLIPPTTPPPSTQVAITQSAASTPPIEDLGTLLPASNSTPATPAAFVEPTFATAISATEPKHLFAITTPTTHSTIGLKAISPTLIAKTLALAAITPKPAPLLITYNPYSNTANVIPKAVLTADAPSNPFPLFIAYDPDTDAADETPKAVLTADIPSNPVPLPLTYNPDDSDTTQTITQPSTEEPVKSTGQKEDANDWVEVPPTNEECTHQSSITPINESPSLARQFISFFFGSKC